MKIHKINGGYLDQDGPVPVSRQTSKQMAKYATKVFEEKIYHGLKDMIIGDTLITLRTFS